VTPRPGRALRHVLFATTVVHGADLVPTTDGIRLPGAGDRPGGDIEVGWDRLTEALGPVGTEDPQAPARLARWLRQRRWVAEAPELLLADAARVVGLPVTSSAHPGLGWVVERVHGDALDLGVGVRGLDPAAPEAVELVAPSVWADADLDPRAWWRAAVEQLEAMGALALHRWLRRPEAPLRPLGDADVVTLLGSSSFRRGLAERHGGMLAAVVPMRTRGWLSLSAVDPAFAPTAAALTEPEHRGFDRPVLVTAEEVALAGHGRWAYAATVAGLLPTPDLDAARRTAGAGRRLP